MLSPDANGNLSVVVADIIRCNPQDVDLFKFTMPPNLGGVVQLRFEHNQGDMALDLLDATGTTVLDTSNVSNANSDPDEQVEVPGSATDAIEYIARARLASSTGGTTGQHYQLEVHTFDNTQCIASEPSGGDDVFQNGRCIGNFTPTRLDMPCTNDASRLAEPMDPGGLAACQAAPDGTLAGCGRMCGNSDADWVRVGVLNNDQVLHAHLDYDHTQGELALVRGTLNSNGTVGESATADANHDGQIDLFFAAPKNQPKEYGIKVKPSGTTGHQVQQYALKVEVGLPCTDDAHDLGAASNDKPAASTPIRPNPIDGQPFTFDSSVTDPTLSRCTNDIDVYKLISFAGEDVTVTLTPADNSPGGMVAELGTEPADLNNAAIVVMAVQGGQSGVFSNTVTQDLFVTVRVPTGVTATGPYTLIVSTTPP